MIASDHSSDPAEALLAGLTEEQRDAVTTAASPLCIIAGAGSGKTRVLTRRVAWQSAEGNIDPRRVLVLTFTRRAASELRSRLRALGMRSEVAAGTFHSAALALLRRYWDHCERPHMKLSANRFSLLAKSSPNVDQATITALNTEIGWARARLITPERYADEATRARRRPPQSADFTASAYDAYQEAKRTRRVIDFDDVLALCHAVLTQEKAFADAQRWYYRHLLVDEFQDVNPLQFAVLRAWLGAESSLALVGDPDQAIYGWNGADPDFIRHVDQHFPGIAVVKLRTNFRSTPEVLNAAARVLYSEPQPAVRMSGDPPTVTATAGDDEGSALARAVRARHQAGRSWRDQAVLARTNAQLPVLQAQLRALGVPTRTRDSGVLRRPEIVDVLDRWPSGAALSTLLADERMREQDRGLDPEQVDLVETFLGLARDHLVLEPSATVSDFVASLRSDDRVGAAVDAVELCTFHAAKGLEWPIVHLVGLEDGLVPVAYARSQAARREEQRLLYVATTRARQELHVMWCSSRMVGDTLVERAPSPWLEAFTADKSQKRVGPPSEVLELLERLDESSSPAESGDRTGELLAALRHWRENAARTARITPQSVLHDSTLRRIAEQEPSTDSELAAIIGSNMAHRFGPRILEVIHSLNS
ncbi:MAG: ATP-dependent DNA helicase UvrD2 [Acidimicrobiaceae bacterium]|nr:ATP-dependent DNA helicase UvrD2 [Acidimicrobiaceae bacterium]MYC41472.1 ATP-dependent DNA helicase UvrD2 [Acidimicrobiaceae bacterium]MYH87387.1 ATP-dependent DNA helicase UvrD2 [Acidimicrobiaceae bacterium]